jgi:SSS family solute:Na+ symporter
MAGNVTAFNTVWTYDIYQSYIRKGQSDQHYLHMAHFATVFGVLLSIGTAYFAAAFNNIMDVLQLVFAFVNAPLFATFLLGMFWKRATGHGAFFGLLSGIVAAAIHQGLTLPAASSPGIKGGWITVVHIYPSEMAQNFWTAIWAWTTCFVVTIIISLFTQPRPESELRGLVYALTEKHREDTGAWYTMGFDIRIPIGFLFTCLGALLVLFGLFTMQSPIYEHSLGMNVNLGWGVVLLIFGLLMIFFAKRSEKRALRQENAQQAPPAKGGVH